MSSRIGNVADVVRWRMCVGCGACEYACPEGKITLHNIVNDGIRPTIDPGGCGSCSACLQVCPGHEIDHEENNAAPGLIEELKHECGRVLEIWEGHARDPEIRFNGSSGGLVSALSLYCLEKLGMKGVVHAGADPADPLINVTGLSTTRADLIARTASRYAPASPCDGLGMIENGKGSYVFVGKPCDITALRKAQFARPALSRNVGAAITFFCAGTPSTQGTIDYVKKLGAQKNEVTALRYRGRGWPGTFSLWRKSEREPFAAASYRESWGFLQAYRPYRCHVCPDGTGEDSDISCGDPWYMEPKGDDPGSSLVVVRTELGRKILKGAMDAGYVELTPAGPDKLLASQVNLLGKRHAVWGRLAAFKVLGIPSPTYRGFGLFRSWLRIPFGEKLRSTLGTLRRILKRGYRHPLQPEKV